MIDLDGPMPSQQLILHMRRVGTRRAVPRYVAQSAEFKAFWAENELESMIMELSSYVLADQKVSRRQTVTLEYPASWWQHFKRDQMPRRFIRRWPVRMQKYSREIILDADVTYPDADMLPPERFGRPVIVERMTSTPWERA